MAQAADLETRFCVVWKTTLPVRHILSGSSKFYFLGFNWTLHLKRTEVNRERRYELVLEARTHDTDVHTPFYVTTFLENERNGKFSDVCSVRIVEVASAVLFSFTGHQILNFYSSYLPENQVKIICLFHGVPESEVQSSMATVHLSNRNNSSDMPTALDFPPDLENLSLDFSNLLKDEEFPDAKLRCGDRTIYAHRAVLAARSEVFAAMFRSKMEESKTGVVDVPDLDFQVLEAFLKYVYTGKIQNLPEDALPSLYAAGDKYAVHALKKACSDRMARSLTEENCVGFLTMADAHSDATFKETVVSFICNHERVLQSQVWVTFSEQHLKLANEVYQSFFKHKRRSHCNVPPPSPSTTSVDFKEVNDPIIDRFRKRGFVHLRRTYMK